MEYEKLYETCYMQVYSYVMTLCKNTDTAQEITQETFFKAAKAGERAAYKGKSTELTWLCSIAKNLYADEMRRRSKFCEMPDEIVSDFSVENAAERKEAALEIHKALHSLEEPYKEVFSLRVFGELSFANIGKLFGKTENWARVTYHRARLKIIERMKQDG